MMDLRHRVLAAPETRLLAVGGRVAVAVGLTLGVALSVLPFLAPGISDVPVLLLIVPVGMCAARFALRGGLVAAGAAVGVASLWFLHGQHFSDGVVDFTVQSAVFLLVGLLVGSVAAEREALERILRRHHDVSLDLICTASFEGYFTKLNPAWERVLGYTREQLMARPFLEFVHPEDIEPTRLEAERQTQAGQSVLNFQNRYRHADGTYRWLEWSSTPDPVAGELYAVARDVTARKEAEAAISTYRHRLERAVDERTAELRERTDELERRRRELEDSRTEMLRRLALAAEYRDDETFEHTERVGELSALVAEQLGLSDTFVGLIRQAAPLHDVGKLGLPDSILLKEATLTPVEFETVKRHTLDGAGILAGSSSDVLQLAEQIAVAHHEWWDGSGYPFGLVGEAIPLSARIVAVVDVYDALIHARPYKRAWSTQEAIDEIASLSGRQFDPRVVDAFLFVAPKPLGGRRGRGLRRVA